MIAVKTGSLCPIASVSIPFALELWIPRFSSSFDVSEEILVGGVQIPECLHKGAGSDLVKPFVVSIGFQLCQVSGLIVEAD